MPLIIPVMMIRRFVMMARKVKIMLLVTMISWRISMLVAMIMSVPTL